MNIYELEKQATPGPYYYDTGLPGIGTVGAFIDTGVIDDNGNPIKRPVTVVCTLGACGGDNPAEDLRYLAHCRNHFMEALEALKKANRTLAAQHCDGTVGPYDALLDELEEVEGI